MAKYRKKPIIVEAIQWTGRNLMEVEALQQKVVKTKEEIINQGNPTEPHCFETDREEQWYNLGLYDGATARIEWHTTADMPETGKRCLMEYEADGEIRHRVDWRSEYEWVEACHYDRVLRWTYIKDILI